MSNLESMAGMVEWAGSNIAYNLQFIPADKLNWQPAPDAPSALEIVNHAAIPLYHVPVLLGVGEGNGEFEDATDLESAQNLIRAASASYAATLRSISPQQLEGTVQMPFGAEWPRARAASLPMIDLIHHHGQIAYLQMLLGDTVSHFEELGT